MNVAPTDKDAVPDEFRRVARLCAASEVTIGGRPVIGIPDARDLHTMLNVGRDFTNWIKSRIAKYGFRDGVDYEVIDSPDRTEQSPQQSCSPDLASKIVAHGGHNAKVYRLTLNMAKELAMVENNERGRLIRRYYIWLEERLRAPTGPPPVVSTPSSPTLLPVSTGDREGRLLALAESRHRLDMVREARCTHGPAAARSLWCTLGLPPVTPPEDGTSVLERAEDIRRRVDGGESTLEVAASLGVTPRHIQYMLRIARDLSEEGKAMLRSGALTVSQARPVSTLPRDAQQPILSLIRQGQLVTEEEVLLAIRIARESRTGD